MVKSGVFLVNIRSFNMYVNWVQKGEEKKEKMGQKIIFEEIMIN